jgi:fatty-acyl-CoA synthase
LRNDGVGSWIARRARRTPDRVAVIHAGDRLTYAQMHDRITRLAHGLRGLVIGRGDRVAYLGPNHPAFLETTELPRTGTGKILKKRLRETHG